MDEKKNLITFKKFPLTNDFSKSKICHKNETKHLDTNIIFKKSCRYSNSWVDLFEMIFLFAKVLLLKVLTVHVIHETSLESHKQIYEHLRRIVSTVLLVKKCV